MENDLEKTPLKTKRNSSRSSSRSTAPTPATLPRPRPTTAQTSSASTFWTPSKKGSTGGSGSARTGTRSASTGEREREGGSWREGKRERERERGEVFFLIRDERKKKTHSPFSLPLPPSLLNHKNNQPPGTPCPPATCSSPR